MNSPFTLRNIHHSNGKEIFHGNFIVIFHARRVPPHLLASVHGNTFSISVQGPFAYEPLEKILDYVKRKKVECLFIEWNLPKDIPINKLLLHLEKNILLCKKVIAGKNSCLSPIRETIAEISGNEMRDACFIFDLLPIMESKKLLGKIYALNMENVIHNGIFPLVTYSQEELNEAIVAAGKKILQS
ncbi:MAG: hypothetical protein HY064_15120 [Bacteroidetes bacterium]|nr:hypothetical protein [Bacteroidota bacterium]